MNEVGKWDGKRHLAVDCVRDGDRDQLGDLDQLGYRDLVGDKTIHNHNLLEEAFKQTLNHMKGRG